MAVMTRGAEIVVKGRRFTVSNIFPASTEFAEFYTNVALVLDDDGGAWEVPFVNDDPYCELVAYRCG